MTGEGLIVIVGLGATLSLAGWLVRVAGKRWCIRWPFFGVTILSWSEPLEASSAKEGRLDEILANDSELYATGVRYKSNAADEAILEVPPRAWASTEIPASDMELVGLLRLDRQSHTLHLTVKLPVFLSLFMAMGVILMVGLPALSGAIGTAIFSLLMVAAFFLVIYKLMFKRSLADFWFLITTKLASQARDA
jgi:hypothetical protein